MTDISTNPLPLAAEFSAATRDDWLNLVRTALKGAPFERLVGQTYDGLPLDPLYPRQADAVPAAGRAPAVPWQVMQRVDHPDPAAANAEALHDLENGATGLSLVFAGAIGAYGYGLPPGADALTRVLDGIAADAGIAIDLDLSIPAREVPLHLAAWVKQRGVKPAAVQLRTGLDPLRFLVTDGASPLHWPELAALLVKLVAELAERGFRGPFAVADGRVIHNAGGSEAQELGYALATGVAYLRALESGGMAIEDARRLLYFRLAADADQFLTTAKFRAMRKLWARVEEACGLAPEPAFIAAETAWRMMTQRDPHVNMLRTTIATVAAGIGGADAITVLPFTMAVGLPDRLARRAARNSQLILLEESNLARVTDPAAGSGAIEALTDRLCLAAWSLLQEIETAGGACAALQAGLIQRKVGDVRTARAAAIAARKDAITGTSEYPNLAEAPVQVLDVAPVPMTPLAAKALSAEPLPRIRLAEPFERLRDASDRVLAETGARPKVFLANLGTAAEFTPRASFAKNFFESGGIEAVSFAPPSSAGDVAAELAVIVAAFKRSGASLACLCSSNAVYGRNAAAAAQALKSAGASHLYLAGRPRDQIDALAQAGVGTFLAAGSDVLATLRGAYAILGIAP
ncbi:MAG: methylmalonyl-CoA mutase [Rhizobiales bacterium]|nr:methylmalonyl-CoA mutase [Hyphomicrobiales bacterium]